MRAKLVLPLSVLVLVCGLSRAADLTATPSTLGSVFALAQGGDRILLGTGNYGKFTGGSKAGVVTLRPQTGASVTMEGFFNPASNITFDGVTMTGMHVMGSSRNLTFTNIYFSGQVTFRDGTGPMNVLFDRCTWGPINSTGYYEGRLSTLGSVIGSCGITVQNSKFGPGGNLDGIQTGANGLRILNNEFVGIRSGSSGIHTDAIQLYGSHNTVIRGNWIHDCDSGIMGPDGTDHETIEDNIIDINYWYPIMMGSDKGSIIRHNTLRPHKFDGTQDAGVMIFGSKDGMPAGSGTIVTDNIAQLVSFQSGRASAAMNDWNLVNGSVVGPHDIKGLATFVGGAAPTTWDGYRLAAGSLGKNAASDGTDMGARTFGSAPAPVADATAPSVPTNLLAAAVSASQINLSWSASTDNVGVTGYKVFRGASQIATVTGTSYQNTGLSPSTAYSYTVAAVDAAGNSSAQSAGASATTKAPTVGDTQAPTVPGNVAANAVSSSQVTITWSASTDNVGVTGYKIYRAGTQIGTSSSTSFSNAGLAASTTYSYTIAAYDAAGNTSAQSASASATTSGAVPTGSGATLFTTQTPALLHNADGPGVNYELGMRFTSTAAGQITAARFWKDSSETGTHTGRIWSAGGVLLASVVFSGETASGWQRQALASPISISANTEYLVSVNTGNTYYVATNNGLATAITNGSLKSIVGSNGRYGPPGRFPTQSWQASNYFRDVEFKLGTTSPSAGTGLKGQYFDNPDFTGATFTRTDATVNFDWGMAAPTSAMGVDYFSVRWTGQVQAQHSQTYTFFVTGDDGVRLWVNGQLLIDKWLVQSPTEYAATINLTAGTKYDIKLEYYENFGGAVAQLRWSSPSTPKAIIPASQLYPAGVAVAPTGTG